MEAETGRQPGVGAAWLLVAALVLVAALGGAQLLQQQANTLLHNGRWIAAKRELAVPVPGATAYVLTRPALFRSQLHLGAWHAYHAVFTRDFLQPERMRFRVSIDHDASASLLLRDADGAFTGLRLSRSPEQPSACLRGDAEGRFLERSPLPQVEGGWHEVRVVREDAGLAVTLDGAELGRCAFAPAGPVQVGFRGSAGKKTAIDDVVVEGADGARFEEDFSNHAGFGRSFALALLLALGLTAVVAAATRAPRRREGLLALLTFLLAACLIVGLAVLVDFLFLGRRHPARIDFQAFESGIETPAQVVERLDASVGPKPAGTTRILFVGTSQTWGAGASHPRDRWVDRLGRRFDAALGPGRVECIDAGISGNDSAGLLGFFREHWLAFDPDVVVVDLSHNDRDLRVFGESLRAFVALSHEHGFRLVFVQEPTSPEKQKDVAKVAQRHRLMGEIGDAAGVPVLPMHARLAAENDTGFLWWDRIHLSSYGQALLADALWDERDVILPGTP